MRSHENRSRGAVRSDHLRQVGRALRDDAQREGSRAQNALLEVDVAEEFIECLRSLGESELNQAPRAQRRNTRYGVGARRPAMRRILAAFQSDRNRREHHGFQARSRTRTPVRRCGCVRRSETLFATIPAALGRASMLRKLHVNRAKLGCPVGHGVPNTICRAAA